MRLAANAPWTVATVVAVILASLLSGALHGALAHSIIHHWGFGVDTFTHGYLRGVVTSNYLVDHPAAILSTVAMIVLFVGAIELRYGSMAAISVWFLATWVATGIGIVVWLPLSLAGTARPVAEVAAAEVGSSAATWCAFGVVLGYPAVWTGLWRVAGIAAGALLIGELVVLRTFTSVEHLAAFGFGTLILSRVFVGRVRPISGSPRALSRLLTALAGFMTILTIPLPESHLFLPLMALFGTVLIAGAVVVAVPDTLLLALLIPAALLTLMNVPNIATALVYAAAIAWPLRDRIHLWASPAVQHRRVIS
jgi:hypothetical protein